jgi:hypothetical protein|tara:strand:+ start:446 stop:760 length:315 start_codon:yes stop_codon:yes gene_type:complete
MPFASGKYAYRISDRSGFRYRLKDTRKEWNGSIVGKDEYEEKHPQLEPVRSTPDAEAIRDARPDTKDDNKKFIVYTNTGLGNLGTLLTAFSATASVGTVTVSTS